VPDDPKPGFCTRPNSFNPIEQSNQTRLDGDPGALKVPAIAVSPDSPTDWQEGQILCSVLCALWARDNTVTGCELIGVRNDRTNQGCYAHFVQLGGASASPNELNYHVCWIGSFSRDCDASCGSQNVLQPFSSLRPWEAFQFFLADDNGVCLAPCPAGYSDIGCSTTTAATTSTATTETKALRIS